MSKLTLGIVGAGNIAGPYLEDLRNDPNVTVKGITDISLERARALADEYGIELYESLDAILGDDAIDLIVNLTIHHAHYEVNKACLEAGKHVFSEKPLALEYQEAKELVELADANGLRLGAAPFTLLYETHQSAWRTVLSGELGRVRLVYAELNWGRMETWHPHPQPYYEVGPLRDVGVYPLTFLTALFGPVREVTAHAATLKDDRVTMDGEAFTLEQPDFLVCLYRHDSGVLTRLTANFYVTHSSKQQGIEIHGDEKSLFLSSWLWPSGEVEVAEFNEPYEVRTEVEQEVRWGTGVREMVASILADEPHRTTGAHAAHIVEILEATYRSISTGESTAVTSDFEPLEPL